MGAKSLGGADSITLVVARLKDGVISAVADTGVTFNEQAFKPALQVPKLCILGPDLAVGFAGDVKTGVDALNQFPASCSTVEEVTDYFRGVQRRMDANTEFLILINKPSPRIIKVSNQKQETSFSVGWIGDHPGFTRFQERTNVTGVNEVQVTQIEQLYTTEPANFVPITGRMIHGMRCVISEPIIPSVNGFCVALNSVGGRFHYRSYGILLGPSGTINWPRLETPIQLHLSEVNSYSFACFVTKLDNFLQAIAYHYVRGKITFMFSGHAGRPLATSLIKRGNLEEFQTETSRDLGVSWTGGLLVRNSPEPDY